MTDAGLLGNKICGSLPENPRLQMWQLLYSVIAFMTVENSMSLGTHFILIVHTGTLLLIPYQQN